MDITPAPSQELHLISSYGGGRFVVRGQEVQQHLLIWPEGIATVEMDHLQQLSELNLNAYMGYLPELLILGTGISMQPVSKELKQHLAAQKVKQDQMDTGAACRTYNVLANEDRKVAAFLTLI